MTAKRALIVDDSRSARVILSRMLEAYDLEVDAAESAEQALEYLRQTRPDVVFMDHLMPGMDGFQAIQAIKSNPETAMIPVMMYTSQEGELYVSQARALGAVGVLPKTVKQGDVSRVLYQLRLLPERRETRPQALTTPLAEVVEERSKGQHAEAPSTVEIASVEVEPPPNVVAGELETAIRSAIAPALKEQSAELRRYIAASLEVLTRKLTAEGKPAVNEVTAAVDHPSASEALPPPAPAATRWPMLAAVAAIALIPTVVLALLYLQTLNSTQSLMQSNARLAAVVEEQQAQLTTLQQAVHAATVTTPSNSAAAAGAVEHEMVPYGETPLSGARLERLRAMLDDLRTSGFHGKVKVATYVGEFCLTGNGIEGYSIAADDLPVRRCDLVGNPFDDSLGGTQRQSLGFANLIASVRQQSGDSLTVEVASAGRMPSVAYPEGEALAKATAGEWNRIAAQNNRVEFVAEAAE